MSVCDRRGVQVDPEIYQLSAPLATEDALMLARAIVRDDRLSEAERMRLMWAALDAARFGLPGDEW